MCLGAKLKYVIMLKTFQDNIHEEIWFEMINFQVISMETTLNLANGAPAYCPHNSYGY